MAERGRKGGRANRKNQSEDDQEAELDENQQQDEE